MSKRLGFLAAVIMAGALFAPVGSQASPPAPPKPCVLLPTNMAYACTTSGVLKVLVAESKVNPSTNLRVVGLLLDPGVQTPAIKPVPSQTSFACVMLFSRRSGLVRCDIPAVVTIDPALNTGSITGTWRAPKSDGGVRITFNLHATAQALSQDQSLPDVFHAFGTGCSAGAGRSQTALDALYRPATPSGSISLNGRPISMQSADASLYESIFSAGDTFTPTGCTHPEPRDGMRVFSCPGVDALVAGACADVATSRTARIATASKTARISVIGVEGEGLGSVTQDSGTTSSYRGMCVAVRAHATGIFMCEIGGDQVVDIDPTLRTAAIQGTLGGGFDEGFFDDFRPPALRFGRISIDLSLTQRGSMRPSIDRDAYEQQTCGSSRLFGAANATESDADAVGHIRFERLYGTMRAAAAHPMSALMESGAETALDAGFICGSPV